MDLKGLMSEIELFSGLSYDELESITLICNKEEYQNGDFLAKQGDTGDDLFVIMEGLAEVLVKDNENDPHRVIINLGAGQLIGEMALVDRGPRSATVRVISESLVVQVIRRSDFHKLCEDNARIGYIVMHNLAADLSFKLRHSHLSQR